MGRGQFREVLVWGLLTAIPLPRRTKMAFTKEKKWKPLQKIKRRQPNQKK